MRNAVLGVIVLGFLLVGLSGLWGVLFPPTNGWTPEKDARSTEVKQKIYNMAFALNSPQPNLQHGQDLGQMKAEYEQLKKENVQLDSEYHSAADTPKTVAKVLRWAGLSLALVGVIGWYAVNQSR
jgi:hypothetical protein